MNIDWTRYYQLVDYPPLDAYNPDGTHGEGWLKWRKELDDEYKKCTFAEREEMCDCGNRQEDWNEEGFFAYCVNCGKHVPLTNKEDDFLTDVGDAILENRFGEQL